MALNFPKTKNKSDTPTTCCSSTNYNKKTIDRQCFPTKELNNWLANRKYWDHNDWLSLLSTLRAQGYADLTNTTEGCNTIGKYLETNRSR